MSCVKTPVTKLKLTMKLAITRDIKPSFAIARTYQKDPTVEPPLEKAREMDKSLQRKQ
jgi:hypothetical protein